MTKAGGAAALPSVNVAGGREYVIQAFGGNRNDRSRTASPIGDAAALPNAAAK